MKPFRLLCACLAVGATSASAAEIDVDAKGKTLRIDFSLSDQELELSDVDIFGQQFQQIQVSEPTDRGVTGIPNIPKFHRYIVVNPDQELNVQVRRDDAIKTTNVRLDPVQPDVLDIPDAQSSFAFDTDAYTQDVWQGQMTATLGPVERAGEVHLRRLTITPYHYNPAQQSLVAWRNLAISIAARDGGDVRPGMLKLNKFAAAQLQALSINQMAARRSFDTERILIVTSDDLQDYAKSFGQTYIDQGHEVSFEILTGNTSSRNLKDKIQDHYNTAPLASVVFFGDEDHVPLYWWSNYTAGDSWYAMIVGNDYLQDFGLGRIPVSDGTEAELFLAKRQVYIDTQVAGRINKNVMLVAHKENYPGKYTANMERIRDADNPRGFAYTPHYGGAGSYNRDVIDATNSEDGYAIINYRGHGSNQTWSGWDRGGSSFGSSQIEDLANYEGNLAVFFNIACNNGSVQYNNHSMAENLLLTQRSGDPHHGAVAVLASTVESYTDQNHDFAEYLFETLQTSDNIQLGNVNATANNLLVRNYGGRLPTNVKMYILFADPRMQPWVHGI